MQVKTGCRRKCKNNKYRNVVRSASLTFDQTNIFSSQCDFCNDQTDYPGADNSQFFILKIKKIEKRNQHQFIILCVRNIILLGLKRNTVAVNRNYESIAKNNETGFSLPVKNRFFVIHVESEVHHGDGLVVLVTSDEIARLIFGHLVQLLFVIPAPPAVLVTGGPNKTQ